MVYGTVRGMVYGTAHGTVHGMVHGHLRSGDEHVRSLLDHGSEVSHDRRVDGAARARPHDDGELRHHARRVDVALEDVRVPRERRHACVVNGRGVSDFGGGSLEHPRRWQGAQ